MTLYDGLPLFDQVIADEIKRRATPPEAPYAVRSDTSREAATAIRPHAKTLSEKVFRWIEAKGHAGATCDEVEVGMDLLHQTTSARIRFLVIDGRLRDSKQRRRTRTGKAAAVWIAGGGIISQTGKEAPR